MLKIWGSMGLVRCVCSHGRPEHDLSPAGTRVCERYLAAEGGAAIHCPPFQRNVRILECVLHLRYPLCHSAPRLLVRRLTYPSLPFPPYCSASSNPIEGFFKKFPVAAGPAMPSPQPNHGVPSQTRRPSSLNKNAASRGVPSKCFLCWP